MPRRLKNWLANGLLLVGSLFITLLLLEGLIAVALSHPSILAARDGSVSHVLAILRDYYMQSDRAIVQFEPECFRYDTGLTYILKPESSCKIVNRERVVEYRANRQGLRDSEDALAHPSIVVVGDSHAMGWGVAQSETFPKVLEREIKQPVLNAAMSSYGTAREMALLERLRLPEFPILIIQYCDNDFGENKSLVDKGTLEISPEPAFRSVAARFAERRHYYPFKHTIQILKRRRLLLRPQQSSPAPDTNAEEVRYFLEVLLRHKSLIEGKTVLVVELNGNNVNDDGFTASLTSLLNQPRFANLKHSVVPLDVSKSLTPADYYVLDDHMRAQGHAKVARLIETELRRRGALDRP
jgi:hypothetical protein